MPPPASSTPALPQVSEWRCPGGQSGWQQEAQDVALIELPLTGMDVRSVRSLEWVVTVGTAALHGANEDFSIRSPSLRPRRSTWMALSPGLLAELAPTFTPALVRTSPRTALLQLRLRQADARSMDHEELSLMLVQSVLCDARMPSASCAVQAHPPAAWRRLALALDECLAAHCDEALSLESLARRCAVSAFHASRVYRRVTGQTLHRQLNRLRLREALFQLPQRRGQLTELALELGFASHSHFSQAFKTEFGHPPSVLADARLNRR